MTTASPTATPPAAADPRSRRVFADFAPTDEQRTGPAFARPRPPKLAHPLSDEQLDSFWEKGYIALPGLFTPEEAEGFQAEAARIYDDPSVDPDNQRYDFAKLEGAEGRPREPVLWKIDPFHDLSPAFTSMVRDRRILDALASIYGGREPRLFKDKLIYKPPHTHGNKLHQDYAYWQGYPTSLISVTISVDPATEANGATRVYPGYEKGLLTEPGTFDGPRREQIDEEAGLVNIAEPGDVLMFHGFAPHEAGDNTTDAFRRQVFLTYNDSADGEHYREHYEHYHWYVGERVAEPQKSRLFFR